MAQTASCLPLALVALLVLLVPASGQGLVMEPTLKAGASSQRQLETLYRQARKWQQRFAAREKNLLATPCASKTGALCSGDSISLEQEIILRLAAAPAAYDTRTFPGFPRPRLNQPFNQDTCSMCVSAAVTAAAEAAVASVLKIPASQVQLSKTFLHYCTAGNKAEEKSCTSGWKIEDALNALQKALSIPEVKCHPNPGTSFIEAGQLPPCPNLEANQPSCKQTFADQGEFTYTKIKSFLEAQDWIRQFGAVVTSMILVKDGSPNGYHLRTFYKKNAGTVPYRVVGAPSNAGTEGHALLLVGYDNEKEQWTAQNSWGPDFADQGYFRIPYNESSIAPLEMMFGVEWSPFNQLQRTCTMQTRPGPSDQPGCFYYKAQAGDFAWLIAQHHFGVDLRRLLLDNFNVIDDVSVAIPQGRELLICGATRPPCDPKKGSIDQNFTQLIYPRPAPLGAYPAREKTDTWERNELQKEVFRSLKPFDGQRLFLTHGHISEICTWWTTRDGGDKGGGWLAALQVKYGSHRGPVYGDKNAFGDDQQPKCVTFEKSERITQMYVWWGLFVDEVGFATDKGRSFRLGKGGPNLTVMKIPNKACLAAVSGYVSKWFAGSNNRDGRSYDQVVGLQFDWTYKC